MGSRVGLDDSEMRKLASVGIRTPHIPTIMLIFYYIALNIQISTRNMRPGVDLASNRNEYQESFLGVKTAGA
jgi:hypothetical protein